MKTKFSTIDPIANRIPELAVIQKVNSLQEQLPNEKHEKAVHAFLIADAIASGISNDLSFVDKIPQFINEIIDRKSWECLYVSKAVAQPYYCCYDKGSDSENFRAFITAKRPNGLGTSVETLDRVLQAELEVRNKFRAIIYQSIEQKRDEQGKYKNNPLGSDFLTGEITDRQQRNIRAANRAAEAIPVIRELLDRGLINIDIAAKLGRQIKDPDNLTAEEREYIDKRDLVGLRINQYINTNTIPEDEDKEPAYRRKLNESVKDLLGIKNRSKAVRIDNPKKAAEKLLKFYEGQKLKELVEYLNKGMSDDLQDNRQDSHDTKNSIPLSNKNNSNGRVEPEDNSIPQQASPVSNQKPLSKQEKGEESKVIENPTSIPENISDWRLTQNELAKRFGVKTTTIFGVLYKEKDQNKFAQWTQKKDPDNIGWTKTQEKRGRSFLFAPIQNGHFRDEEVK